MGNIHGGGKPPFPTVRSGYYPERLEHFLQERCGWYRLRRLMRLWYRIFGACQRGNTTFWPWEPLLNRWVLTYMSLRDEIKHRVAEGRLHCLPPSLPSSPCLRVMFVSDEVKHVVDPPTGSLEEIARLAQLRADLDMFTEGKIISVSEEPYTKPKSTYLARVDPPEDEVWDIRSRDPKPGIRVLGCFAETDVFVALCWNYREILGGPGSKEWRDEIQRCKAAWTRLFHPYPPFSGGTLHDYVSRNVISV